LKEQVSYTREKNKETVVLVPTGKGDLTDCFPSHLLHSNLGSLTVYHPTVSKFHYHPLPPRRRICVGSHEGTSGFATLQRLCWIEDCANHRIRHEKIVHLLRLLERPLWQREMLRRYHDEKIVPRFLSMYNRLTLIARNDNRAEVHQ
jgi:hypothetical protein